MFSGNCNWNGVSEQVTLTSGLQQDIMVMISAVSTKMSDKSVNRIIVWNQAADICTVKAISSQICSKWRLPASYKQDLCFQHNMADYKGLVFTQFWPQFPECCVICSYKSPLQSKSNHRWLACYVSTTQAMISSSWNPFPNKLTLESRTTILGQRQFAQWNLQGEDIFHKKVLQLVWCTRMPSTGSFAPSMLLLLINQVT